MNYGLTKENFFNELMEKYSIVMHKFCKFIDKWKQENEWDKLFNPNIKFHDLPIQMQMCVMAEFCEVEDGIWDLEDCVTIVRNGFSGDLHRYEEKLKSLN